MKFFTASVLLTLSTLSFGFSGQQLIMGSKQTLAQAIFEVDQEAIEAFQAKIGKNIESVVRYHDEATGEDKDLEYGCHLHGDSSVACHEEGHAHLKSVNFNDFYTAYLESIDTLLKSFSNTNRSIDSLVSIKAWKGANHHKNGDEGEVWVKYEYENQGKVNSIFTMCHKHDGEIAFDCHFSFSAPSEPSFDEDHEDEDHHDHNH